jgi:RNA polymerase sigma factor for flagellar operon FliA
MVSISHTRDSRILSHTGLPRMLAARVARRAPASVDLDDLIAAGTEGLIQAADRFDAAAGVPFGSFAHPRVRGAILDVLRAEDHLSRGERRRTRAGLDEHPSHRAAIVALEDAGEIAGDPDDCPLEAALRNEAHGRLAQAIATLPERSQRILSLYYAEELTLRQIGQELQVTESRVCQLLRAAHQALSLFFRRRGCGPGSLVLSR